MNNNGRSEILVIGDRERSVIQTVMKMNDTELFGLQCYLAGMRANEMLNDNATPDSKPKD